MATFCAECRTYIEPPAGSGGTGYGIDSKGRKVCYECCGRMDGEALENLGKGDKMALYINESPDGNHTVTNWPSSLKIPVTFIRRSTTGAHAAKRRDVWFSFRGGWYHGRNQGDSDILVVRRCKGNPPSMVVFPARV